MTDAAVATPLDSSAAPVTPSASAPDTPATPSTPATPEPSASGKEQPSNAASIIDNANADNGNEPPADGDADWRKEFTGGDEKLMKRISRYTSPASLVKALIATQDKLRSAELAAPLPENPTDEQKAEWRKSNGIPDKADGYQLPKVAGFEWSDADKEVANDFFGSALEANMSQTQAEKVFNWYAGRMQEIQAKQYEADNTARATLEDDLRTEWGAEYRSNIKILSRFAEKIPGVGANILEARLPDGRRLGEVKEFVSDLVERGRDYYGDSSFIAGDGGAAIANRKAEIEAVMKADMQKYRSSGMADEYRKILEAEERSKR